MVAQVAQLAGLVGRWIVDGDPLAQAVLCVALLVIARDLLALRFRRGREAMPAAFPPVSILKPVHGGEPAAESAFRSYCSIDYPAPYEVIFALEDGAEPLYPLAAALAAEFPQRVRCVLSGPNPDPDVNGKSHNLAAAAEEAAYRWLLISDSDTIVDAGALRRLVAPLADARIGVVAAFPRVTAADGWPARMERLLVNAVLAPCEYALAQLRGPHGLWGTLLLVDRRCVDAAGGFRALGRYLAEDIALEDALQHQGRRGALLRRPVDVVCAKMTWRELLRHWHRWLVGLRHMRPLTHACMALILLAWLVPAATLISLPLDSSAALQRGIALAVYAATYVASLFVTGWAGIGVREPLGGYATLPAAVAVLFVAYVCSWLEPAVVWRGRRLRVGRGGRIVPPAPPSAAPLGDRPA